jgi:RNA polymerase sigma-70 factor (ECF subfamily)
MLHRDAQPHDLHHLLRRIGLGDASAVRELHRAAARPLLTFAMRIVKSRDGAEDVLQESLIAIWRDAHHFDAARASPMTWMMTIVRNKAIDALRASTLRERLTVIDHGDAALARPDPAAGPCELVERAQRSGQLRHGMAMLGPLPRQAIELAFFHDMTHDEVALRMTIPLGTVKTWIRRGCRQMRGQLERAPARQCKAAPLASMASSAGWEMAGLKQ